MTGFNKANCKTLRAELNAVLEKYGKQNNLEFTLGNIRFSETELKIMNVEVKIKGAESKDSKALKSAISQYRLKEQNSKGSRLIGYNRRRYAYPFLFIDGNNGKTYKASLSQLKILGF